MEIINITNPGQPPVDGDFVEYNYGDGRSVRKTYHTPVDPPEPNHLCIHLAMTDGDGREPLGIKNNGVDALGIVATFRQSEDPASPIITAVNMAWRVTIRNEAGLIYDIVDVSFVEGVASFSYTTTGAPDICGILESDFEPYDLGGTIYEFKLIGNATFKVYRQL